MYMCIMLVLLIIGSKTTKVEFKPDDSLKDKRPSADGLWITNSTSAVSCAIQCYKDNACMSFFYSQHKKKNTCRGYKSVIGSDSPRLIDEHGWTYFHKDSQNSDCLDGWIAFDKSCYHINVVVLQWHDAMEACKDMGGYLVEIESAREDNFINGLLQESSEVNNYFIGATDEHAEGQWIWANSSNQMVYTNWYRGEPNGGIYENYACISTKWTSGMWFDVSKWYTALSICEMRN